MGMETDLLSEGNETALIIITGIFLMFFMSIVLLAFFYFSKKKIVQKELEKKMLELDYQKGLMLATIEVQEEERMRIAQDLHDDISSKLNIVSLNSHLLTTPDLTATEVEEITGNIINLVSKALDNSRRIAHDLLPPVLDKFGLHAGIKELCFEVNSSKAVAISYENNVVFNDEDKNRNLNVFRIIQELINNSLRHGKATEIVLQFDTLDSKTVCHYKDNGRGFDMAHLKNKKGLGMKNIESRIIFLEGTIDIDSEIDKGIKVFFKF